MAQNNAINNRSSTLTVDNAFTVTTGAVSINSGTSGMSISTDASATTINIGTGGAAKAVTLGSTNSSSSLALQYGTGDMTLASASGTVFSALDTGEITRPLQPAFLAVGTATESNVTGDGTDYTLAGFNTEIFDQGGDFASNTFTAPVTGRYYLGSNVLAGGITAGMDNGHTRIVTSNRTYLQGQFNYGAMRGDPTGGAQMSVRGLALADMDAADTATLSLLVTSGALVVDIIYNGTSDPRTIFYGWLAV